MKIIEKLGLLTCLVMASLAAYYDKYDAACFFMLGAIYFRLEISFGE
jgi:hypothetical protein